MAETTIGDLVMPHYHGVDGSLHELDVTWAAGGITDDGSVFEIIIEPGFRFDGCSVPRALWRVAGHPLEVPRVAAALAHDWLYAAHVCDRYTADQVYKELLYSAGVGYFRRMAEYYTLRLFGWVAWNSHGKADNDFARGHGAFWFEGERMKGTDENG